MNLKTLKILALLGVILLSNCKKIDFSENTTPACEWTEEVSVTYNNVNIRYPQKGLSVFHENQLGTFLVDITFTDVLQRTGDANNANEKAKPTANTKITKGCTGEKSVTFNKESGKILPFGFIIPQPNVAGISGELTVTFQTDSYWDPESTGFYYVKFDKTTQYDPFATLDGNFMGKKITLQRKTDGGIKYSPQSIYIDGDMSIEQL